MCGSSGEVMRALKRAPKGWSIPKSERCIYEKKVNNRPMIRCRYRAVEGDIGIMTVRGYCGIHLRMMRKRQEAKLAGNSHHGFTLW